MLAACRMHEYGSGLSAEVQLCGGGEVYGVEAAVGKRGGAATAAGLTGITLTAGHSGARFRCALRAAVQAAAAALGSAPPHRQTGAQVSSNLNSRWAV